MSKKPMITFLEIEPWEIDYLKKHFPEKSVNFFTEIIDKIKTKDLLKTKVLSSFIYSKIDQKALRRMPDLKAIATRSTGFDHINLKACAKRKIAVMNVPFYGENTVAEHTFALILALSRKIFQSYEKTERMRFDLEGLRGFDLKDKTLGIIGCGHIGQHVARIAQGFEMKVMICDPKRDSKLAKKLKFSYVTLDNLLKKSDIITLHAPYNKKTHHLINKRNIVQIKRGAILINTARGGLVDTTALVRALNRGILSGAGLDVLEEEMAVKEEKEILSPHFAKKSNLKTILENHLLIARDDVIIPPHNAFNSQEALERILDTTIENIKGFLKKKPQNTVS